MLRLSRRDVLGGMSAGLVGWATGAGDLLFGGSALAAEPDTIPFTRASVLNAAKQIAAKPFQARTDQVPKPLRDLTYDQYREIRFRTEQPIWLNNARTFALEPLLAGFIYDTPVDLWLVSKGQAQRLIYKPDWYQFGKDVAPLLPQGPLPFSGFRIRTFLNGRDHLDEVAVFQGASYFRAVGAGVTYGLSARGLAIATGAPEGEEFPVFRAFFIEKPADDSPSMVVWALLDSPSTTGAYRITVRPGQDTTTDVELTLYPRRELKQAGLAPFSSMFLFDSINRGGFVDYREAVHDSDGLSIWRGNGDWLWRPLNNRHSLQVSAFVETSPRGFGLVQRERAFVDYEDAEARYDLRTSAWVEPVGDWGAGSVVLFEIPTEKEIHDNIVAFWRPNVPIPANQEWSLTYRLHWAALPPQHSDGPRVEHTRFGTSLKDGKFLFAIDFTKGGQKTESLKGTLSASTGQTSNLAIYDIPTEGLVRVSFEFDPAGAELAELFLSLEVAGKKVGETWLYRWTA